MLENKVNDFEKQIIVMDNQIKELNSRLNKADSDIKNVGLQQYRSDKEIHEMEKQISQIETNIKALKGTINPAHRPPKEIELSEITSRIEKGMSARTVASILGVTTNTITSRLEEAGYHYFRGKWSKESHNPYILKVGTLHKSLMTDAPKFVSSDRKFKFKRHVDIVQGDTEETQLIVKSSNEILEYWEAPVVQSDEILQRCYTLIEERKANALKRLQILAKGW